MSKRRGRKKHAPSRRSAPPSPSRDEQVLRERIQKFTYQSRFKGDFGLAIRLYFGESALQNDVLSIDEDEIPGFQEWYIHDYVTSEGKRIIDLFADEKGQRLPAVQRRMLNGWQRTNRCRLLEVQAVEPGIGITVQDLLSGEIFKVNDISSSYTLTKWQVLLMRPLLTEGRLHFTGSGVCLPPKIKPDLLEFAQQIRGAYQIQHPQASLDDFYRDHSLDIYHRAMEIGTAPPPVYTMEGHPFVVSEAHYAVTDPRSVEKRLDQAEEFLCAGPADEDETALAYAWVLTGRSHVPEVSIEEKGLVIRSSFVTEGDNLSFRSLGDLRLWQHRLKLSCTSRERLAAGKALIEETLGDLVQHLSDEYQDVETLLQSAEPPPPPQRREPMSREERELVHQMIVEQYKAWLDESIPALDGATPRQAAQDPAMREQLEELLKSVEYTEERRRRKGEPYVDIADIRRDLGLPPR